MLPFALQLTERGRQTAKDSVNVLLVLPLALLRGPLLPGCGSGGSLPAGNRRRRRRSGVAQFSAYKDPSATSSAVAYPALDGRKLSRRLRPRRPTPGTGFLSSRLRQSRRGLSRQGEARGWRHRRACSSWIRRSEPRQAVREHLDATCVGRFCPAQACSACRRPSRSPCTATQAGGWRTDTPCRVIRLGAVRARAQTSATPTG